jgi:16S rRNA processing protein RimM
LEVSVPVSALPVLPQGEYYWRDLQGLRVRCQDGDDTVLVGLVDHLIETGANDVLVVKACEGSIDMRERLIPYLPGNTVIRVDLDEAVIEVDWFLDDD